MDANVNPFWAALSIFVISICILAVLVIERNAEKAKTTNNLQLPMRTQMYTFGHSEEFKTMDGMPCVVFTNDKGAGLSCDWRTRAQETDPDTD